ncbi:MAG: 16S rRNA (uracil(1498)-N(3))-methyltransferase [Bacilli bacterium]|nr:16S rRNA (uracil(1498)-N(3))-methyltransferase [Bacilli bacterium]
MQRYFAKEKDNNKFILGQDDYYHIKTVMRMVAGDKIEVVYENVPYLCELTSDYEVLIKEELTKTDVNCEVNLILPLLKEQKMDLVLQKSTELGVNNIYLFNAKRSIIRFDVCKENRKLERWSRICKEASEQSKRCDIPNIIVVDKTSDLAKLDGLKLICSTLEIKNNLKKVLQSNKNCAKINLIVGPEGGFDPKEETNLIELGFIPVTLGNTILRVETVPIFLIGAINYEYME